MKAQEIRLQNGTTVTVDWDSKCKCKKCGKEIYWAVTKKNKKFTPIELVGLAEWDVHWITCPASKSFRKK